jgi:hypothetical protein
MINLHIKKSKGAHALCLSAYLLTKVQVPAQVQT